MREIVFSILAEYLPQVFEAVLVLIIGLIGRKLSKYINTQTKKNIIKDTVKYVEQIYTDIHGETKLNAAKEKVCELLKEKGIDISENELIVLIESAVNEMNKSKVTALLAEIGEVSE